MLAICATVSCNKIDDYLPNHKKGAKHASVYVMSNDAGGNHILIYDQKSNGTLSYSAAVATGGNGAGGGIGSQGAIALSDNGKWLYTVNAGSNSISAFSIAADGNLELKQQIDAGGEMPVSLDSYGKLLYVVNGSSSICGFKIGADGMLQKIPGSVQMLSQPMTGPAQVSFAHNGHRLVVTEKATNMISNFLIDASGAAGPASSAPAEAQTPFGFSVQHANQLVVTDAFGGGSGASEVTSYRLHPDGSLQRLDRLATGETAACWIALDAQQRFGLITNTGSNNISSIHIDEAGSWLPQKLRYLRRKHR